MKRYNFDPDVPSGLMIVHKPEGKTSAQLVATVKKKLNAKKVGHTGTLDPFATGVLICCINQATKLSQFFLEGDKTYEGLLHLGIETDTQDRTGQIVSQRDPTCSHPDIVNVFDKFVGEIEQKPPVFSALKHNGVPLYRLARKGQPVQKPSRKVRIYALQILDISLPFVKFIVRCSSGTYIRTLCADIGQKLTCGGHLKTLCRIESCGYKNSEALTDLEMLDPQTLRAHIVPINKALRHIPKIMVTQSLQNQIQHGGRLFKNHFSQNDLNQGNTLQLITPDNILLAVIRWQDAENECKVIRMLS